MEISTTLLRMSDKRLIKWYAWRKLRFNLISHFAMALIDMLSGWLGKERVTFSKITSTVLARQAEAEAKEEQNTSWRHNLAVAEVLTIALGGTDNRKGV